MSKILLEFKGLMSPVFTPFKEDEKRSINLTAIESYASYMKKNGINGVLINGTTGEGPALSVNERKVLTESWDNACKKYGLTLMVQIGGAPIADVIDLAEHAEKVNVDAILCLPELYFKPKSVQGLVEYLKQISKYCPTTPLLYYHIPMQTGLNLHMPTFCDLAEREIKNFVGIKYTSGDLDQGSACLKEGRHVFLGADTILSAGIVLGFDSAILTTLNICPNLAINIVNYLKQNRLKEAQSTQRELTAKVNEFLEKGGGDWVPSMKKYFNENCFNVGPVRNIAV